MDEYVVTNAWIQKQKNQDKYTLYIYDEINGNVEISFTGKQLKKLHEDTKKRIKTMNGVKGN